MWCAPTFFPSRGFAKHPNTGNVQNDLALWLLSARWEKSEGVLEMPFRSCVPGFKLKGVAPSFVTFWRESFTAEVPNELTRDVIFSGSAPYLEQPALLKIACWPGCDKKSCQSLCRRVRNNEEI